MADSTYQIVRGADNSDLLTLQELKLMLGGVPITDNSQDASLSLMISMFSEMCATYCHRFVGYGQPPTFGKVEMIETWREVMNGRVYLGHWPVKSTDIVNVNAGGTDLTTDQFEIEEWSGKVSNLATGAPMSGPWNTPVVVHYSGGYVLPDDAPLPLKHAVVMLIREERIRMMIAQSGTIRQLTHKEARITFFDPTALLRAIAAGLKTPTMTAVENILDQYIRIEV